MGMRGGTGVREIIFKRVGRLEPKDLDDLEVGEIIELSNNLKTNLRSIASAINDYLSRKTLDERVYKQTINEQNFKYTIERLK